MDNEQIVNRLIDILNSQNQNLLIGNITSPRIGTICQVSTPYGIKSAYNINCTYPGDACVVWDKDEKQYYCFTVKPSTVINSRQLSFRKNRPVSKNTPKLSGYVLVMDADFYSLFYNPPAQLIANNNIFFEDVLEKLKYNKKLYIAKQNSDNKFLDNTITGNFNTYYLTLANYLTTKDVEIIEVEDTELSTVDSVLWMPNYKLDIEISFTEEHIQLLKDIGNTYGLIFQSEANDRTLGTSPLYSWQHSMYYINTFSTYLRVTEADLVIASSGFIPVSSNIGNSINLPLFNSGTGIIPNRKLTTESKLTKTTGGLDEANQYCNVLYW